MSHPGALELREWPNPYGPAHAAGVLKHCPDDFVVEELIGFEASGEGEFDLLRVRKRGRNTNEVARALARFAGVPFAAISYAGLKDKRAVTTQYFSVHLPGKPTPAWAELNEAGIDVLDVRRHSRKLRRGAHTGNRFELRIRDFEGSRVETQARWVQLQSRGIANYFGQQRFGRGGSNLVQAAAMLAGKRRASRHLKGLWLSALRAFLFNEYLAHRVEADTWSACVEGDFMILNGSTAVFGPASTDDDIGRRLAAQEIHPTGPLVGAEGKDKVQRLTVQEEQVMNTHRKWVDGLADLRVKQARRSLRVPVEEPHLSWALDENPDRPDLRLSFSLPAGSYATVLLEQLGVSAQESHG